MSRSGLAASPWSCLRLSADSLVIEFLSFRVARRAEMIRITSSESSYRYVCTTTSTMIFSSDPMACHRSSPSLTRSMNVMQNGSSKTSCAVSTWISCLILLAAFFTGSHETRACTYSMARTPATEMLQRNNGATIIDDLGDFAACTHAGGLDAGAAFLPLDAAFLPLGAALAAGDFWAEPAFDGAPLAGCARPFAFFSILGLGGLFGRRLRGIAQSLNPRPDAAGRGLGTPEASHRGYARQAVPKPAPPLCRKTCHQFRQLLLAGERIEMGCGTPSCPGLFQGNRERNAVANQVLAGGL
jgi:hypothetical protein